MDTKLLRTSIACAMLGLGLTQLAGGQAAPDPAAPKEAATRAAPAPEFSAQIPTAHTENNSSTRCDYREMASNHGHDAFLAEPDTLVRLLTPVFD